MPFVYLITTIGIYLIGLQTGTISYYRRYLGDRYYGFTFTVTTIFYIG